MNKTGKSIKILHVIHIGGIGGAEKLLLQLLPALQPETIVECLVIHRHSAADKAVSEIASGLNAMNVKVHTVGYSSLFRNEVMPKIMKVIADGRFDIVHSHLKYADTWLAWLKLRGKLRLPVVTTVHSFRDEYESRFGIAVAPALYRSAYYWVTRFIYRRFQGFVLISEVIDRFTKEAKLIKKTQASAVIPHGYRTHENAGLQKHPAGRQGGIAVPGRLLARKGQHLAIEALQHLDIAGTPILLHLYGEGPAKDDLQRLTQRLGLVDQVIFHGYVTNLPERLSEAAVVVIPSLSEAFGLVFLDAFAAGTPVVAFDVPASNEIVVHGQSGLLAGKADPVALAAAIREILVNPQVGEKLTAGASERLATVYAMGRMTQSYIQLYQTVIDKYGARPNHRDAK